MNFDFTHASNRRDARLSQIYCDDRGAAETAHNLCTALCNLKLSTSSQTSTLVKSPTWLRNHSTLVIPKYPIPTAQHLSSSKMPQKARKPYTKTPKHTIFPQRTPKYPNAMEKKRNPHGMTLRCLSTNMQNVSGSWRNFGTSTEWSFGC